MNDQQAGQFMEFLGAHAGPVNAKADTSGLPPPEIAGQPSAFPPPSGSDAVQIDFRTVELIRRVWLPKNPNKMRDVAPEVVQAARMFIAAYDAARARRQNVIDEPRRGLSPGVGSSES
jgi:hypothetical protein